MRQLFADIYIGQKLDISAESLTPDINLIMSFILISYNSNYFCYLISQGKWEFMVNW